MKLKPLPKMRAKLDKIFSLYVRLKNADNSGNVECFTCGITKHYKKIQAGHFQSRRYMNTRWSEVNVQPQCVKCNMFNQGEQFKFAQRLDMEYGEFTAETLEQKARKNSTLKRLDIEYLLEFYTNKLKDILTD